MRKLNRLRALLCLLTGHSPQTLSAVKIGCRRCNSTWAYAREAPPADNGNHDQ